MKNVTLLRTIRTVPDQLPDAEVRALLRPSAERLIRVVGTEPKTICAYDTLSPEIYDPWFCVACGHPHHGMTRHHRLPKRVAWKIPVSIWKQVLDGDQRVVPMCGPCHAFIEKPKGRSPCHEAISVTHAKLTWEQLIQELRTFDRLAYERTEDLIRRCRAGEI